MLDEDYSLADRLLHRLSLGSATLSALTFDLDQQISRAAKAEAEIVRRPHVFVMGLARAGTTILMRSLHETGEFRSLTYRDMPFPLAPNLWKMLGSRRKAIPAPRERAHGDRILTNFNSPEALDEVFWRVQTGSSYIRGDGLLPYDPDQDEMALFGRYVAAVIASGEPGEWRYLSKNNNNILRLPALLRYFPEASFIIPFRAPASHATSLWRQHRHFSELQRLQPFVRSYMDWLVHHEFGLGHRPFRIGQAPLQLAPAEPDYWLDLWIRVHERLGQIDDPRCLFVSYEDLCSDDRIWSMLRSTLNLKRSDATPGFSSSALSSHHAFDPMLLARAEMLHERLRQQHRIDARLTGDGRPSDRRATGQSKPSSRATRSLRS